MKISSIQFIEVSITNTKMLKKETKQENIWIVKGQLNALQTYN